MTNDDLERVMNFIIAQQERTSAQQERTSAQQEQTAEQIGALAGNVVEHDQRIARFERSYTAIADLLQKHDGQIGALTDAVQQLTQTVDRYISARGNGHGNGQR